MKTLLKKKPKMYVAVFLVALLNLTRLLFGWGWYTYYCGFNLWYIHRINDQVPLIQRNIAGQDLDDGPDLCRNSPKRR